MMLDEWFRIVGFSVLIMLESGFVRPRYWMILVDDALMVYDDVMRLPN